MLWQRVLKSWHQRFHAWKQGAFQSWVLLFLVGVSLTVAIAACSGDRVGPSTSSSPAGQPVAQKAPEVELTLVSFAVTKAAHDAIIPKFVEYWQKEHNQTVIFKQASYGGSGTQTQRVIEGGLDADVVHLALGLDMDKLVQAGLVAPGWVFDRLMTRSPSRKNLSKNILRLRF